MLEVRIESLAFGGDGVGHHQGQAVFVPRTAPGDLVRCRVTEKRRRYLRAELVELLEAGPGRCVPICPVFGRCGGCHWQHLGSAAQLAAKHAILEDILRRQLRCEAPPMQAPLAAEQAWHYRSRVQFKCHALEKELAIGFYRRGSHFVEAIESCPIAAPPINELLPVLRRELLRVPRPDRIPQVDVEVGDRGLPRVVVHDIASRSSSASRSLAASPLVDQCSLFVQTGRKASLARLAGEEQLEIRVDEPPLWLSYGPGGFAQIHLEQNRRLVAAILDLAALRGDETVLDLFCGMGNLSLPLARRAGRVDGVEAHPPSIEQARINAAVAGVRNVSFTVADAACHLRHFGQGYDLVVLDPPRAGARGLVPALLEHRPARILYVSCDPMTLARDLKPLLGQGYRLVSARAADLFPQTYHLESLVLLERSR